MQVDSYTSLGAMPTCQNAKRADTVVQGWGGGGFTKILVQIIDFEAIYGVAI